MEGAKGNEGATVAPGGTKVVTEGAKIVTKLTEWDTVKKKS